MILVFIVFTAFCCINNITSRPNFQHPSNVSMTAYCELHAVGKCGSCICIDDFDIPQKYYCDCTKVMSPKRDCLAFYEGGMRVSGIYEVTMNGLRNTVVYCDQTNNNGGWTVIQRRYDGSTNFYRNWKQYKEGFGKLHQEFWFGNDNIHLLSAQAIYPKGSEAVLQIQMFGGGGYVYTNKYAHFQVAGEQHNYVVLATGASGGYVSSIFVTYNSNMEFSTYDRDNDKTTSYHCARKAHGGWWYNMCDYAYTNLNGEYNKLKERSATVSYSWYGNNLEASEIKMRRLV